MERYAATKDAQGQVTVEVDRRGRDLVFHPMFNKGTAFSDEERRTFGLTGLLPRGVAALEVQSRRVYANIARKTEPLERYIGLAALQDRNETLFYRVMLDHLEELLPIVYTPTVGQACQTYSHIFRRGRGLWITPDDEGRIDEVLQNAPFADVRLIVVTDNERILGLGDQGAGGMGIPIGKLALYTVAAGLHPAQTLPISLDVGTDNRALLDDPLYIGWRNERLRGARYDALVEEFVAAVQKRFPRALLQWEDFKKGNAFRLLDRYRDRILSFNDDIQGTAAIALAGVLAACRARKAPLSGERFVILGAGAAGIGIARQLRDALVRDGVKGEALRRAVCLLDSKGLLIEGKASDGDKYKEEFAWPASLAQACGLAPDGNVQLARVVDALKPTVLIGTSGQPAVFDEKVVRAMASHAAYPVIMPFSNPTSLSEAVPADVMRWTDGRALVATGSPFDPVHQGGRVHRVGQGNNVYVFPGVGLGALAAGSRRVTDAMFTAAAFAIAERVPSGLLEEGGLYPPMSTLRAVTRDVAFAVAKEAVRAGDAPRQSDDKLRAAIDALIWEPVYPRLVPAGAKKANGASKANDAAKRKQARARA